MSERALPVVGAALTIAELATYRDWLLEAGRDVEIQDPAYPMFLDGDWRAGVRTALDLLDGHRGRIGIHGPFVGLNIIGFDPKVRAVVQERLFQGIEVAHALGGSHMVVHSPFEFFGHPMSAESPAYGVAQTVDLIRQTLEPVVAQAAQAGVTLVIETIHDTHPRPLLMLVDSFASETVRLSIDVGHTFITHRLGGPSPDQWVHEAGPRLAHLHLQDSDALWDRHWGPGRGQVNWFALFEALGTLAHSPRLILELRDKTDIPRAAGWLAQQGVAR